MSVIHPYLLEFGIIEHINNVISRIFKKLIKAELNGLQKFTVLLIDTLACKFNYNKTNIGQFIEQITQNNNRDIISIMYLLLPYIDDRNDFELFKQIYKLQDITSKKKIDIDLKDKSINQYLISNFQYSRYFDKSIKSNNLVQIREKTQVFKESDNLYYEYNYNLLDLELSFKLVLYTIDLISSKLYINWINIVPLTIQDYKTSEKYKNSFYYDDINKKYVFNQNNQIYDFNFWNLDIDSPLRIYGGIGADDVFNTIYVF